jgi:mannose-6-phosphate isomerase-like protein (cupin superfamily)
MKNRVKLNFMAFLFFLGLTQMLYGQDNQNQENMTKIFTIENCVNEFSVENADETKSGYRYWFADKDFIDGRTLKLSVVKPKQATHPPHTHSEDEFFFILEGKAAFYLDGKTKTVGPYTSLYCPSDVPHGISNAGETELKYLVIKKYPK